jgi:hypothetical protein
MDNNGMNYNGVGAKWNGNQWKGIIDQGSNGISFSVIE